jgi:hypothetical protein
MFQSCPSGSCQPECDLASEVRPPSPETTQHSRIPEVFGSYISIYIIWTLVTKSRCCTCYW